MPQGSDIGAATSIQAETSAPLPPCATASPLPSRLSSSAACSQWRAIYRSLARGPWRPAGTPWWGRGHPETGTRRLDALKWGLVPHFTKDFEGYHRIDQRPGRDRHHLRHVPRPPDRACERGSGRRRGESRLAGARRYSGGYAKIFPDTRLCHRSHRDQGKNQSALSADSALSALPVLATLSLYKTREITACGFQRRRPPIPI
jgi:hypothetical protein